MGARRRVLCGARSRPAPRTPTRPQGSILGHVARVRPHDHARCFSRTSRSRIPDVYSESTRAGTPSVDARNNHGRTPLHERVAKLCLDFRGGPGGEGGTGAPFREAIVGQRAPEPCPSDERDSSTRCGEVSGGIVRRHGQRLLAGSKPQGTGRTVTSRRPCPRRLKSRLKELGWTRSPLRIRTIQVGRVSAETPRAPADRYRSICRCRRPLARRNVRWSEHRRRCGEGPECMQDVSREFDCLRPYANPAIRSRHPATPSRASDAGDGPPPG